LKIAFDEHVPRDVAQSLKAFGGDRKLLRVDICSARDYSVPKAKSDVPWLERFAMDGGRAIVSGDAKMRGKLHERKALTDAGFIVFFLARAWNEMGGHAKCAMLILWWPFILAKLATARKGQFFEIPCSFTPGEMKEVSPPPLEQPSKRPRRGHK